MKLLGAVKTELPSLDHVPADARAMAQVDLFWSLRRTMEPSLNADRLAAYQAASALRRVYGVPEWMGPFRLTRLQREISGPTDPVLPFKRRAAQ